VTITPVPLTDLPDSPIFLQSSLWGTFRKSQGWTPFSFTLTTEIGTFPLLVLVKSLGGGTSMAYIPQGPQGLLSSTEPVGVRPPSNQGQTGDGPGTVQGQTPVGSGTVPALSLQLKNLSALLKPHLPPGVTFLRWDLTEGTSHNLDSPDPETFPQPLSAPFKKGVDVQPPDTVILNLLPSEDAILEGMHKKTRYNIRLAEKKGVIVREAPALELTTWYDLYRTTSERDKISIHPLTYYQGLFATAENFPQNPVKLWLAEFEGTVLAGIITIKSGDRVTYLYGASSNESRNLMPAYLLQWKAIQWAKAQGAATYDLFGIPPTGDEGHPMHGLYRFKTGFGGVIHHRLGSWDLVYNPLAYFLFSQSEKLRTWYYKVWKKR